MSKRWDTEAKIKLMKLYSEKKSYDDIGKILDRSPNAIKLRLESIVYDNLVKGKQPSILMRMLNTDQDTIKQLYYSHRSFREMRKEPVKDVVFPEINKIQQPVQTIQNISTKITNKHPMDGGGQLMQTNNLHKPHNRIEILENENKALEEIIRNYKMKRQVRKLYLEGKLDDKSTHIFEKITHITKN
jgi:hypothetical protein